MRNCNTLPVPLLAIFLLLNAMPVPYLIFYSSDAGSFATNARPNYPNIVQTSNSFAVMAAASFTYVSVVPEPSSVVLLAVAVGLAGPFVRLRPATR